MSEDLASPDTYQENKKEVEEKIKKRARDELREEVKNAVRNEVRDEVRNEVKNEVRNEVRKEFQQELESLVTCPACLVVPRNGPLHQCSNGHMVCDKCYTSLQLKACPTCREKLPKPAKRRCLVAEQMIDKCNFDFPCIYSTPSGCDFSAPKKDLEKHETCCNARPVPCPDINCQKMIPLQGILDHIKELHTVSVYKDFDENGILYRPLSSVSSTFCNWVLSVNKFEKNTFFASCSKDNNIFYAWVYIMAGDAVARNYKVKISIEGPTMSLSHTSNLFPIDKMKREIVEAPEQVLTFGMVHAQLCTKVNIDNASCLVVKYEIIKLA